MVTLPKLRYVLILAVLLRATDSFKIWAEVYNLTGGGPGIASEVPAKYVYEMTFRSQNLGQGFAAVLLPKRQKAGGDDVQGFVPGDPLVSGDPAVGAVAVTVGIEIHPFHGVFDPVV